MGARAAAAGGDGGCIAAAAAEVVSVGEVFGGGRLDRAASGEPALDGAGAAAASGAGLLAGGLTGGAAAGATGGVSGEGAGVDAGAGAVAAWGADGRSALRSCVHATRSRSIGSETTQSRCTSNFRTVAVAAAIVPPLPEREPNDACERCAPSARRSCAAPHKCQQPCTDGERCNRGDVVPGHYQREPGLPAAAPAAGLQTQCSACAAHLGTDCWRVDKPVFGGVVSIGACDQAKAVGNITSPHPLVVDA